MNTAGAQNAADPWNRERELGLDFDFEYGPHGRLYAAFGTDADEFYLYDDDGKLVHIERRDNSGHTVEAESFAYDGDQMVASFDAAGVPIWEAIWGAQRDHLVEWHDMVADRWYSPIRDHRNSIVATLDQNLGVVDQTASYTAEGRMLVRNHDLSLACQEEGVADNVCPAPSGVPFAFNSMWRSPVTGLSYMRNRWYSPRLAQFTSHDPLGFIDSYNAFAFSSFDPVNMWDPFGLGAAPYWEPCAANDGCFEMLPGAGSAAHAIAEWVEEKADDHAEHDTARRKRNRDVERELKASDSRLARKAGAAVGGLNDLDDRFFGVESGDDVMLEGTLAISGGLLGKLFRKTPRTGPRKRQIPRVCSFTAGTPVLMCDGSLRPIEEVEEGDFVVARDEETGAIECREVIDPYENPDRSIIVVELAGPDGVIEQIETTDNHPFYVEGRGWTRVDDLHLGDLVPNASGAALQVVSIVWTDRVENVYNFGVEQFRTYFVGEVRAWVHNCLTDRPGKIAQELGHSVDDVTDAIHALKGNAKFCGSRRNPDVLVDTSTGDVYIKDPKTRDAAEHIDNIFDYLSPGGPVSWRVGSESTEDGRTLEAAVSDAATVDGDYELISWISDNPHFGVISHSVWRQLTHRAHGVGLCLYVYVPTTTRAPPSGAEKYIEWVSPELELDVGSTDLDRATEALFRALDRPPRSRDINVEIGRYSESGQFNLHFPQALVKRLAEHQVNICG